MEGAVQKDQAIDVGDFLGVLVAALDGFNRLRNRVEAFARSIWDRLNIGFEAGFKRVAGEARWKELTGSVSCGTGPCPEELQRADQEILGLAPNEAIAVSRNRRSKIRRRPLSECREPIFVEEVIAKYHISDRTIGKRILQGVFTDFRIDGHARNEKLTLDEAEVRAKCSPRSSPIRKK